MPRKLKITFYLFFIIIFLPTLIFSIFEMGNYSHYEKKIEQVLEKSLNTALYTINQYTNEVISEWNWKITDGLNKGEEGKINNTSFLAQTPAIKYFFEIENGKIIKSSKEIDPDEKKKINELLAKNNQLIDRLKEYFQNEYRKTEALKIEGSNNILILFICKHKEHLSACAYVINTPLFINDVLGPKTQETAEEDFYISVFNSNDKKNIYSSDLQEKENKATVEQEFWLLPGYSLGISLKSNTISDIIRPRTQKFLLLSIAVTLALLFGVYMLFRSMRHQIELAQLKSEFISNVSHEIRTPLALVQMYIETLEMDRVKNEEKKKEYYNIILQETIRLSGIVNKILNFTRIEKGKREYQFSDTDVNAVIENIMGTYRFHLENRGFEYITELTPDLPLIFADKEAIGDAVINLIDNAVKYSNDKKSITIRSGRHNDKVYIEVQDFGIGITEKEQKNVFDKFYRVTHGDLALKAKGTGLGLTIVKHVMDAHHGEIDLKSRLKEGSSFKLLFPPEGAMY